MAFEVPISLIRELQISVRKEAGIESYDPDDPSLADLPSLEQTISELDPSPPHLRCQQCRGPLLRGLQSMVCVYCGAQQRREIPPDPIHFRSTIGYQWLLQSFGLDGSEAVEESDSSKVKNASKDQLVLSDLFDFELKWSSKSENNESKISDKAPYRHKIALNLEGVDLDNFFSETKKEISGNASKEQEMPSVKKNNEIHAFTGQDNINLFENPQSSTMTLRSTEGALDDNFSGWGTEFQAATFGAFPVDSRPTDLFPSSSPTDNSKSGGFVPDTDIKFEFNHAGNDAVPPTSMSNSWMQDDQWHSPNTGLPTKSEQLKMTKNANDDIELTDNSHYVSSVKDDWSHDDLWPTGGLKVPENEKINEDDDAFDAWQGFTSSGNTPDSHSSLLKDSSTTSASANEQASEMNLANFDNNLQDMDFGNYQQPDLFSGALNIHNSPTDVKSVHEAFTSERVFDATIGEDAKSEAHMDENSHAAIGSESADNIMGTLMSQMPDLSFMLESNLSIPQRADQLDSSSWN